MEYTSLTASQFDSRGLADWRVLLGGIRSEFAFESFPAASAFVAAVTEIAERRLHHPDIEVRYPGRVSVTLTTHATGGLTTLDADVAAEISAAAAAAGGAARPLASQAIEFAIDTLDADRIRPFWKALLDYVEVDGWLVDPRRIGPSLWFQQMDEPRIQRGRFHVDVTVPHDIADARVDAALAAGGRLVTGIYARSWWVLSDADGNEACVCTWQDRE